MIERAHGDLRKLADDIAGEAEDMGDLLAKQDKEQIEKACKDVERWLGANIQKATKAQIEEQGVEGDRAALDVLRSSRHWLVAA